MQYVQGRYVVAWPYQDEDAPKNFSASVRRAKLRAQRINQPIHILATVCVVAPDGTTLHFKND